MAFSLKFVTSSQASVRTWDKRDLLLTPEFSLNTTIDFTDIERGVEGKPVK